MRYDNYLFYKNDLGLVLEAQEQGLMRDIDSLDSNRLLNSPVDELVNYFIEKFSIEPIVLHEDKISTDQSESQIDVSRDPNRFFFDRDKPFFITGTKIDFYIPYEGDSTLYSCRPSHYTVNPPQADIKDTDLVLSFQVTDHDSEKIKKEFEGRLDTIKMHLTHINNSVVEFNSQLDQKIRARISSRQEKVKKDQGLIASFGFPMRKRDDAPETYVVPQVKRKIVPQLPPTRPSSPPEPVLDMGEYEIILKIISNMVTVMERSPKAFIGMGEEDLRTHFLVQLNGQYEGQATGETFNSNGKTDILIRADNKNIFIAECKIWKGDEVFKETIDQILGYTSWRDTKTAIILFNRNKNTSNVLSKIPEILRSHPNFIKETEYQSETGFRVAMRHINDKDRELTMTVLVFDVPTE